MAYATRKVVKGPGGKPQVQFVNAQTGEPIDYEDLEDYELIEQGNNLDFLDVDRPKKEEAPKEEEKPSAASTVWQEGGRGAEYSGSGSHRESQKRDESNNFGYINAPGWLGWAAAAPGMIGMAAKAARSVIGINNAAAVNSARTSLGMPASNTGMIGGLMGRDNKGYLGDIVVGDTQYAVGLEAANPAGRTTLTPQEARSRAAMAKSQGLTARPASPDEAKAADKAFKSEFGTNIDLGSPRGLAKSVVDKALNRTDPNVNTTSAPTPTGIAPDRAADLAGRTGTVGGREITPGIGLANLAPGGLLSDINRGYGPQTVGPAQPDLEKAVQMAAMNTFGPGYTVNATSGARTNSQNHMGGRAVDFNVTDPQGNRVTDTNQLAGFAAELGRQGVQSLGYGKGYMGPGMMHAGMAPSPMGATSWGALGKQARADPTVKAGFDSERTPGVGILPFSTEAIPTANPAEDLMASGPEGVTESTAQGAITDMISGELENNLGGARGIPQETINQMALTISGELGSATIQGILSGNPAAINTARQEIADIAATMNNRANSQRYSGMANPYDAVMTGTQYNSLLPGNMGTTNANMGLVGDFVTNTLGDYNAGTLTGKAPNATNYFNPDIANPGWAPKMSGVTQTGQHQFGTLPEYQTGLPSQGPIPTGRPGTGFGGGGGEGGNSPNGAGNGGFSGGYGAATGRGSGGVVGSNYGDSSGPAANASGYSGGGVTTGGFVSDNGDGSFSVYGNDGSVTNYSSEQAANDAAMSGLGSSSGGSTGGGVSSGPSGSSGFGGAGYGGPTGSANDNRGAANDTTGAGSGGGGQKVLCGYFYSKGRIPTRIYAGDLKYAKEKLHPRTKAGYQWWAKPLVNWLDRKASRPIIDNLLFPVTYGWVYEMAYRVGYSKKRTLWGRIVVGVGEPLCYILGLIKEIKEKL